MKLSKKNQARQRAIRKALASGKSVSGLLAGALTIATTGCNPRSSPRGPIGRFPDSRYEEQATRNATNEAPQRIPMGDLSEKPPTPPKPPETPPRTPNTTPPPLPMRTQGMMPSIPSKNLPPPKPNK